MNKLGDRASSRELAALWARFARIVHFVLQRDVHRSSTASAGREVAFIA
jgi:hypothetical protein